MLKETRDKLIKQQKAEREKELKEYKPAPRKRVTFNTNVIMRSPPEPQSPKVVALRTALAARFKEDLLNEQRKKASQDLTIAEMSEKLRIAEEKRQLREQQIKEQEQQLKSKISNLFENVNPETTDTDDFTYSEN